MTGSFVDLTGHKVNKLTVLRRVENLNRQPRWLCQCECGNTKLVLGMHLRAGKIQDCGCGHFERMSAANRRHGMTDSPTWATWKGLRERCCNPNAPAYKNYGGRGITLCERWRTFENFLADMGERPEGMTLDRIDNDGNYEPGNCRWATFTEQANNRRTNVYVTINGETKTLKEWAAHYKVPYPVVKDRRSKGVDGEALFAPLARRRYNTTYEAHGKALTLTEWARELNEPYITVWQRVHLANKNPDGTPRKGLTHHDLTPSTPPALGGTT